MTWEIFKTWHKKFEEKKMEEVLVQVEKVQAPVPIPKPGFGRTLRGHK